MLAGSFLLLKRTWPTQLFVSVYWGCGSLCLQLSDDSAKRSRIPMRIGPIPYSLVTLIGTAIFAFFGIDSVSAQPDADKRLADRESDSPRPEIE